MTNQILQHNPALVEIRQRGEDVAAHNQLKIAMWLANSQMRLH